MKAISDPDCKGGGQPSSILNGDVTRDAALMLLSKQTWVVTRYMNILAVG